MKKILNLLLCSIIFATNFIFLNTKNVSADTNDSYVVHNWIPNFYSHKERSSNWAQLSYIYANGEIAYCVDPGVELSNGTFSSSTDFSIANIGVETRRKLELYAAYGYNYSNHNTDKYYAATQELIWRELGVSNMWFTTEKQGGENIDVSAEKNEILRLWGNNI